MTERHPEVDRLIEVMHALRAGCPWDAAQTHESLVHYLVEEALEVVEAIETGGDDHLLEELGDLLLQVVFHAEIAAEQGRFDIDAVAARIADKLVARHPYVFTGTDVPEDLISSWERAKAREKGRSSALDGIPHRMSALARAHKVLARARSHGFPPEVLSVTPEPVPPEEIGARLLACVAAAEAAGVDPEQALRGALRPLENRLRGLEGEHSP